MYGKQDTSVYTTDDQPEKNKHPPDAVKQDNECNGIRDARGKAQEYWAGKC